jgi:uncharacterized delta-60 repeat protein
VVNKISLIQTTSTAVATVVLLFIATVATAGAAPSDLDPTFGAGGQLTLPIVPGEDRIEAIAVQPDGKIVAAGTSKHATTNWDFAVARFNPDGSPDTTFSGDGFLTADLSGSYGDERAYAVAVQPDGKIVVAGFMDAGPNEAFAIARYMPDGSPDIGFGGSIYGYAYFLFTPTTSYSRIGAIALQPDGKIVAAGKATVGGNPDFALVRLLPTGMLDTSFDVDGKVRHPVGVATDEINDIAIQPDGRIVAVGESQGGVSSNDVTVARYNTDGSLDTSFNLVGVQTTALSVEPDAAEGVVLQPDGKIVIAGQAEDGAGISRIVLVRYGAGGGLDFSFGTGGIASTDFAPYTVRGLDIALQNNSKFVVVGDYYLDIPPVQEFLVAQYDSSGALDKTFDGDGVMTRAFSSPDRNIANAVAVQSDGKILAGGLAWTGTDYDFAMMRLAGELPIMPVALTPTGRITSPSGKRVRAKRLKLFKGTAGPDGEVAKVEIALRRVDRKQLKRGRCLWLKSSKAKFAASRAVKKRCSRPRFLPAAGTKSWSYRLKRRLKKGKYELLLRVTLKDGSRHIEFSKALGNLRKFSVV